MLNKVLKRDILSFITVTIPLNHKRNVESSFSIIGTRAIGGNDDKILGLMEENSNISVSEISRLVGLGTTTVTKRYADYCSWRYGTEDI